MDTARKRQGEDELPREAMTSEERILAAVRLEQPDRVPVDALLTIEPLAHLIGTLPGPLYRDFNLLLEALLRVYDDCPFDIFEAPIPASYECYLLGGGLEFKSPGREFPDNQVIQVVEREVLKREDYAKIAEMGWSRFFFEDYRYRVSPPIKQEDVPRIQNAIDQYASKCVREWEKRGVRVLVGQAPICHHPFFKLSLSRSLVKFTEDLYYEPTSVEEALRRMTSDMIVDLINGCRVSKTQIARIEEERASGYYYPPKIFERFWWPYTEQIVRELWSRGIVTLFHLDTPWDRNINYFRRLPKGSAIIRLDGTTDILAAKQTLGGHLCLMGDVHPAMLSLSNKAEVEAYCRKLISQVGRDGGFILSTGCCVPPNVKPENFRAMIQTAKNYLPSGV